VIVISGFARWSDDDVKSLLEPGAFIEKPFAFSLLRAKVEELMNGRLAEVRHGGSVPMSSDQILPRNGANAGHLPTGATMPVVATTESGK
jgi:hypothetical protein